MYYDWLENEGNHVSRNAGNLWKPRLTATKKQDFSLSAIA